MINDKGVERIEEMYHGSDEFKKTMESFGTRTSPPCEYCSYPLYKSVMTIEMGERANGEMALLFVEIDGEILRTFDNNPGSKQINSIPINFCPMCGRKLKK